MVVIVSLPDISEEAFKALPALTSESAVTTRSCEPCGYLFERRKELQAFLDGGHEKASQNKHADPNGADSASSTGAQRRVDNKKVVKISEEDLEVDWYDVLKLTTCEGSSEDQVRSAYRRRCLETHPDKQPNHSDEEFKRVQRAFEILGDPDARRAYDSSRPFDDTIPGEEVNEERFYNVFGPVFDRNKKWSMHHIPSLGDADTPIKAVTKFYDSWMTFQSWRDFSHEVDVEEIDDSMCREEKRFYQRENERQLNHLRRQETKRVRMLVERAMKNDPRLRKKREEEEAKREAERQEREAERRRLREEEDRRRAEIAEKDRLVQEERHRAIVEAKSAVKNASQAVTEFLSKNKLIDTVSTNLLLPNLVRQPNIQWFFSKATPEEAKAMETAVLEASVTVSGSEVPCVVIFNNLLEEKEKRIGITRYGEPIKKQAVVADAAASNAAGQKKTTSAAKAVVWSDDDLILLQKAIAKFPGGTVDRWRRIAVMMREKFTEEDVLAKTKELEAALRAGTTPSKATVAPAADGSSPPQSGQPASAAAVPASTAPAAAAATAVAVGVEDWTPKQQKQLEQGLRELKEYKEKDKFQKVAAFVEGKTAKQCFERFKYLCSVNKK